MNLPSHRFRDPRTKPYHYLMGEVLVCCPGCSGPARIARAGPDGRSWAPRRLTCAHCGFAHTTQGNVLAFRRGVAADPWFGEPLWLRARTRHGDLWAYNREHLTVIRDFVAATLRERAPWYDTGAKVTVVARLPRWAIKAGNREEILRAIDRIRRP
ncbi:hypothetical protein H9Y04_21455 [Streptomyces sp. TRM66268-LWL]|uniref:GATA-type domain-containing protein n=1 Tax=Streptomyces polyasparticus TaxID=2767826 RepID=A0ABR7SKU5_9ACTN|nr:hypothetical protein [Streptomyces polyasparticus]MBC9715121.1 hypothetical protein [Streptomyces polyasparticus]